VIIHDLDSLPLGGRLFESLYEHWLEEGVEFCGISQYHGNGVTAEMNLVRTAELVVDAHYLRERYRPIHLFNKLSLIDGRLADFDTMLHVQWQTPRCALRPIDETCLAHVSRVICNYTDFMSGRNSFKGSAHNLLMLPYLLYLGGQNAALSDVGPQLANPNVTTIRLFGKDLCIDGIPPALWAWKEKLIRRVEQVLYGQSRPDVLAFLVGFISRAGESRTVGTGNGSDRCPGTLTALNPRAFEV
jgi:hypothetical protein